MGTLHAPEEPAKDHRFIVTIMVDGHGRADQVQKEYRECLERMLWNEFGELAQLTNIMETSLECQATEEDTLHSDDPVVLIDHPDSDVVED